MRPSLTGGSGYIDNQIRPEGFRRQDIGTGQRVQPSIEMNADSSSLPSSAAATNAQPDPPIQQEPSDPSSSGAAEQQEQAQGEEQGWWSPGMEFNAMGYDSSQQGTYTYGGPAFYQQ